MFVFIDITLWNCLSLNLALQDKIRQLHDGFSFSSFYHAMRSFVLMIILLFFFDFFFFSAFCKSYDLLTLFFALLLLSSKWYERQSGKQQSSIQHDHPNAVHAYTSSFVLVKWILTTTGKKGTKKALDRDRSMSLALKDRLQRARLHPVQQHSSAFFFIIYSRQI